MASEQIYKKQGIELHYYEIKNDLQPLVLIHAQGVDAASFTNVWTQLSKKYHVYSIDCYGHGKSLHNAEQYNLTDISNAMIRFIEEVIKEKVFLLGHSSGGLIAAYIASNTELCKYLILEDPPFFSSQGEKRKNSFNYIDLSTVCHNFINQSEKKDFVLYYFSNQYAWNFFPEKSREKIKGKMIAMAAKYRRKHPDRNLKVMFWPKVALSSYQGMNHYDPLFGETFFDDSFHCGILHEEILKNIRCKTVFMKAQTKISEDGILMAALSEEDLERVSELIADCQIVRFDCGHGIHIEKPKEFIECVMGLEG
ncbi:MAG: alpha/beta hydrolase [Lachnospiraceae bacterium]|nr:alpha/beta hydrolase [Lachnospiraceae bacterium]